MIGGLFRWPLANPPEPYLEAVVPANRARGGGVAGDCDSQTVVDHLLHASEDFQSAVGRNLGQRHERELERPWRTVRDEPQEAQCEVL